MISIRAQLTFKFDEYCSLGYTVKIIIAKLTMILSPQAPSDKKIDETKPPHARI